MKNAFNGLIRKLNITKERTSELKEMGIENSKAKTQKEKGLAMSQLQSSYCKLEIPERKMQ